MYHPNEQLDFAQPVESGIFASIKFLITQLMRTRKPILMPNSTNYLPTMSTPGILRLPVDQLDVYDELKRYMKENGFNNLDELLQYSAPELLKTPGFTYRCLESLLRILDRNGYSDHLRERE